MGKIIDYFINELIELFRTVAVLDENEVEREYIETSSYTSESRVSNQVLTF